VPTALAHLDCVLMTGKLSRVPYLELAAEIREQIRSGQLVPGDRLKTVRALAAEHSVAQGTVGSALEVLRGEGLIDTVQGRGSVVIATPSEPGPGEMAGVISGMEAALRAEIADVREYAERLEARVMTLESRDRNRDSRGASRKVV
jgi:DNA-binding GntR family transcriptional regulator